MQVAYMIIRMASLSSDYNEKLIKVTCLANLVKWVTFLNRSSAQFLFKLFNYSGTLWWGFRINVKKRGGLI